MSQQFEENKQSGWIRLYRSLLENGWFKNHRLLVFWIYCLLKASHKPQRSMIGHRQVDLLPGQFIFGRKKAAQETGLSEQQIRTNLASLRTLKNLTIKTTNKYSIVTIVNWEFYQSREEEITSKVTSTQPALNHIQELKNVRKKNKGDFNLVIQDTEFISELQRIYPSVNISSEIQGMKAWLFTNPAKNDYYAFIRNWLKKANNGGKPKINNSVDPIDKLLQKMEAGQSA